MRITEHAEGLRAAGQHVGQRIAAVWPARHWQDPTPLRTSHGPDARPHDDHPHRRRGRSRRPSRDHHAVAATSDHHHRRCRPHRDGPPTPGWGTQCAVVPTPQRDGWTRRGRRRPVRSDHESSRDARTRPRPRDPGRIDQAIELSLPDSESRRRLLELYTNAPLPDDGDEILRRLDGVAPAFIKELARRAELVRLQGTNRTRVCSLRRSTPCSNTPHPCFRRTLAGPPESNSDIDERQ